LRGQPWTLVCLRAEVDECAQRLRDTTMPCVCKSSIGGVHAVSVNQVAYTHTHARAPLTGARPSGPMTCTSRRVLLMRMRLLSSGPVKAPVSECVTLVGFCAVTT
jgi:hypothetical protein